MNTRLDTFSELTPPQHAPSLDLVVFGATSFVGRLLCRYLHAEAATPVRWAMAGRSESRLQDFRQELATSTGKDTAGIPVLVADASDEEALRGLCAQTRLIVSTVGPYALYGEPLLRSCVITGTDYCDLTGEVQWVRRMIQRYEAEAQKSGARILHSCGFDSIPSDLGVWHLQTEASRIHGEYCRHIRMRVKRLKGGASGGTIASMINVVEEASADPDLRRELADTYSLCPADHPLHARQHAITVEYDEDNRNWAAPFIMSGINTRVVHRTHALAGAPWGKDFCYDEAMLTGDGNKGRRRAVRLHRMLQLFIATLAVRPGRWLMRRFLPSPGEGPSPQAQLAGSFDLIFTGRLADGRKLTLEIHGDRDPGYGATSRMLGQTALCLLEMPREELAGGFWTPATALGERLVRRLQENEVLRFTLTP
jgi:short subunit dehydrogenase-like uncharacterized protein